MKGLIEFLRAVPPCPDLVIALAGEGPLRPELEVLARSLPNRVLLLGHLAEQQLRDWYAAADLAVLPSLREPYGVAAIEAAWAALPLLLSNHVGAAADILEEGKNGWLVNPQAPATTTRALREAVELGREGLAALGRRSREIAERDFEPSGAAHQFVSELMALPR